MNEEKTLMYTIRGTRYAIKLTKLTKLVKGMPGFAPEWRERIVGEVVFNFPHDEENVYFQPDDNMPSLDKEEVEQLLAIMSRKFEKSEWKHLESKDTE